MAMMRCSREDGVLYLLTGCIVPMVLSTFMFDSYFKSYLQMQELDRDMLILLYLTRFIYNYTFDQKVVSELNAFGRKLDKSISDYYL
jgi:hypothetical protein